MPFKFKTCSLCFIVLLFVGNANAQTVYGQLKLKARSKSGYLWDRYIISSKDTTIYFYRDYGKREKIKGIPIGEYKVTLNSRFNDNITHTMILGKKNSVKFNEKNYYQEYTDTISLLDLMTANDTLRIYYNSTSCHGGHDGYCSISKDSFNYKIITRNQGDTLVSAYLKEDEVLFFRQLGKYLPPDKLKYNRLKYNRFTKKLPPNYRIYTPLQTSYCLELNNKVLTEWRNYWYVYGLLISKGLLKRDY